MKLKCACIRAKPVACLLVAAHVQNVHKGKGRQLRNKSAQGEPE